MRRAKEAGGAGVNWRLEWVKNVKEGEGRRLAEREGVKACQLKGAQTGWCAVTVSWWCECGDRSRVGHPAEMGLLSVLPAPAVHQGCLAGPGRAGEMHPGVPPPTNCMGPGEGHPSR